MTSPRLLIVEDQEAIAAQLRWALADEYEVSTAGSGRAALESAEALPPDLVTLDLDPARSPVADYEAVRKELLQYDPKLAERPEIVALSQADRPEVREAHPELARQFAERFGVELLLVSAATRFQLDELLETIARRLPPRTALSPAPDEPEEDSSPAAAPPAGGAQ